MNRIQYYSLSLSNTLHRRSKACRMTPASPYSHHQLYTFQSSLQQSYCYFLFYPYFSSLFCLLSSSNYLKTYLIHQTTSSCPSMVSSVSRCYPPKDPRL